LQNIWQDIIAEMSQVLTVGSESLAAGFATRNNHTRTAERNRRLPLDERALNVPFKFGLRFHKDFCLVHVGDSLSPIADDPLHALWALMYILNPIGSAFHRVLRMVESAPSEG
jgi:hypothetical protein